MEASTATVDATADDADDRGTEFQRKLRRALRRLSPDERAEARELLGAPDRRGGRLTSTGARERVYRPDLAEDLLDFFRRGRALVEDAERVRATNGRVEWVARPVRVPTLAAFAAKVGVPKETVSRWARKHPEFGRAVATAKAIQEATIRELVDLGALNERWASFLLRCNHDGYEPVDRLRVDAGVQLVRLDLATGRPVYDVDDADVVDVEVVETEDGSSGPALPPGGEAS